MKFTYKGYAYYQDTMVDECCDEYRGWVLLPIQTQLLTFYCDNCEEEHTELDYNRPEMKELHKNRESYLQTRHIDDDVMAMIKKALGVEKIHNGEYIEATFEVEVKTIDTILLGDSNERN